jgi:hypothetical protein
MDVRYAALVSCLAPLLLMGCAAEPTSRTEVAPQPAPVATLAASSTAAAPATTQFPGYRKVESKGETKYCRQETGTGTRLGTRTICMTEAELQRQGIDNQRAMETFNRKQVPASDSGSAVTRGPGSP